MKPRYTQAQKEKAVTYYAEHNISITQACREMGYPHRDMLCAWIQEIRPDLLSRKQGSCKKDSCLIRYTKEEKYSIVEEWMTSNIPVYRVAAKYRVSKATISKWKCLILGKDSKVPMRKNEEHWLTEKTKADLQSEIVRLQAENHMLRMERDALQKASELLKSEGNQS
ncbi:transposase [Agathobaculum sp. Marseille-P7918]|uniref:transposase n=1 Tax=Agathobaculum sp. Marseille-P7918 TaxID=2479843 RepID=UPI0035646801